MSKRFNTNQQESHESDKNQQASNMSQQEPTQVRHESARV